MIDAPALALRAALVCGVLLVLLTVVRLMTVVAARDEPTFVPAALHGELGIGLAAQTRAHLRARREARALDAARAGSVAEVVRAVRDLDVVIRPVRALVELRDDRDRTPLHLAVENPDLDVLDHLLTQGHPVGTRDADGRTPLHLAVLADRPEVAVRLLEARADLMLADGAGITARDLCAVLDATARRASRARREVCVALESD